MTGVGFAVVGVDGRIARVDRQVERIVGRPEAELLGRHITELAPGLSAGAEVALPLAPEPATVTLSLDGTSAVFQDVSERLAVASALEERVKELTALHATSRLMSDPARPVGERLSDVAALLPPAMQFPAIASGCIQIAGRRFATTGHAATPWLLRTTFDTAAGEACAIEVSYRAEAAFLDEERELLGSLAEILCAALDREAAELQSQRARERLDFALASAGMGVWEWDVATGEVFWSKHLAAMAGIERPISAKLAEYAHLIHDDDRAMLLTAARRVAETGRSFETFDARIRRPDGSWRPVHVFAHRTADHRVMAVFVDVTARQSLEEALRTAQKLEALGQVAGGVAHDFNNLLQIIIGGAEVLRTDPSLDAELQNIANEVRDAGMRGAGLANQLLSFSRSSTFAPATLDVNASIRALEPILARLIRGRATLVLDLDPAVAPIHADPTQLEQILLNLVVNARDAMDTPGIITVSTARSREEGRPFTVIGVRDTGPGMTPDVQEKIFEPFFTTKAPGKGTGLGLAVVRNVVRQWNGHVTLDSAPGQGAYFRVAFPEYAQSPSS